MLSISLGIGITVRLSGEHQIGNKGNDFAHPLHRLVSPRTHRLLMWLFNAFS
jgi:hypothetical protein